MKGAFLFLLLFSGAFFQCYAQVVHPSNDGKAKSKSGKNYRQACDPVVITTDLPSLSYGCDGGTMVYSLQISGTSVTYQWQEDGIDLANTGNYSGVTTSILTISNVTSALDGKVYRCVLSNACSQDTSQASMFTAVSFPSIVIQPADITANNKDSAKFFVRKNGGGITYQWQVRSKGGTGFANLTNGSQYKGVFTDTLTILSTVPDLHQYEYRCELYSPCDTLITDTATLSVIVHPELTYSSVVKVYGDAPFLMTATSISPAPIIYAIDSNATCTSLDVATGMVSFTCAGTVKLRAIQIAQDNYLADTAYAYLTIDKARPLFLVRTGGLLYSDTSLQLYARSNSPGADIFFAVQSGVSVVVTTTGLVFPVDYGVTTILVSLTEEENYYGADTLISVRVVAQPGPPVARDDAFDFTSLLDTVNTNVLLNDSVIVGLLNYIQLDLDTLQPGVQTYYHNDALGDVWADTLGNVYFKPFVGLAGVGTFGYQVYDTRGNVSNVAKIRFYFKVPDDLELKHKPGEIFTPNGDTYNDQFIIGSLDLTKKNILSIYNRHGFEVFYDDNYQNDWMGYDKNGRQVDDGVYYFSVYNENNERLVEGRVYIIK